MNTPLTRHRAEPGRCVSFFVALAIAGACAPLALAATALSGTVTNAATGRTLEGARVMLEGTTREPATDAQGDFRFDDVPAGTVTPAVTYTGLDAASVPVTLAPAGVTRRDVGLTAGIYKMDQFVVSGEREGNAQAVTLQRLSDGVKNIVSTDSFGNLAQNPADLLVHSPASRATPWTARSATCASAASTKTSRRSRWTATASPTPRPRARRASISSRRSAPTPSSASRS